MIIPNISINRGNTEAGNSGGHPEGDLLLEDDSFLLLEDGASTFLLE